MRLGIIGMGIVGKATAEGLKRGHDILGYDKYNNIYNSIKEIAELCSVIFITVPTPMKRSGEIDLSAIYESVGILHEYAYEDDDRTIIVIRSTAVSGTTDSLISRYRKFDFAFNPEFLTAKNATEDFLKSERIVIGVNKRRTFDILEQIYREAKFECLIIKTDIRTAEMIKYCSNVFLAGQIVLANELYEICQLLDVDYKQIVEALKYDKRIGTHIKVPGPDLDRGMGGRCLPKDLNALIYLAREYGYRPDLLEEIWRTNLKFRKNIDWL